MANPNERWEDNVPGRFYVDRECIICSLCSDIAPQVFRESDDGDHDIVHKQPESEEEVKLAREALDQCPVEAIGEDG